MKRFFQNLFNSKGIVSLIGFVICIVLLYLSYNYRIKEKTNPVEVYYAKEEITSRTEITSDMIGKIDIPASMLTSNVIRDRNEIVGKYVNYNAVIPAGSLFYKGVLVEWAKMPDSAWSDIPEGNTIVSLSVNVNTTFGNSIFPKDKIDLYYKSVDKEGKLILGKLIEGIEVLAVKDDTGNHIFKREPEQRQASALIFSVTEEMHLLLRKAMYLNGEIIPVPRNMEYGEVPTISSTYLQSFILAQTIEVPLDVINNTTENNTNTENSN